MKSLTKDLAKTEMSTRITYVDHELPEKIIQFGEGNFLRGFVDWMVHEMNKQGIFNGKIVAIQPTPHGKVVPKLNAQDGLYTLALRGIEDGEIIESNEIISSISRGINPYTDWQDVLKVAESNDIQFVFSNTTEAGLTYVKEEYSEKTSPLSFPGKVTAFLYHRFKTMNGSKNSGLVIIPCELVEDNGQLLQEIVLKVARDWNLSAEFINWVEEHNTFCNTLVDRIVTGYPTEKIEEYNDLLGYIDELLTTGEPYHLFAIDADQAVAEQLPFHKAGLNVKWGDVTPYRELKVRLLNGPHTMMFAACFLAGSDTVLEAMKDPDLLNFIKKGLYHEILLTVSSDESEKNTFVDSVIERFLNPYNRHLLTDIGMNTVFKFKTRLIPSLLDYIKVEKRIPQTIAFSLAALIVYYRPVRMDGAFLVGKRGNDEYTIRDNKEVLHLFMDVWKTYDEDGKDTENLIFNVLKQTDLWGLDLNTIDHLHEAVVGYTRMIEKVGMKESIQMLVNN
ncbi:tagaturonate reductase [bacterium LRH843]|nr:tagaturonate reductase [bacterium LRH843]